MKGATTLIYYGRATITAINCFIVKAPSDGCFVYVGEGYVMKPNLWQSDTDRIVSISCHIAQGGQGKYSNDCCMSLSPMVLLCKLRQCK